MLYYLLYILLYLIIVNGKIVIKDASVAALSRGDIGMIFYLTLENACDEKFRIYVRMLKCCEDVTSRDKDCNIMTLLGGDMGILNAKCSKNITLLYPNMYLHNRKGECSVSVLYLNEQKQTFQARKSLKFDTTMSKNHIPWVLRGYYNIRDVRSCQTIDMDPLDNCQPVNCPMKYLGFRNYFNHKWKRCQKVPICVSDPEKDLPDVAYIPISNRCRDLEQAINKNDLKHLQKGIAEGCWQKGNYPFLTTNLRCHHGTVDNETGFCSCDEGWMSVPFDKDQYEPSLSLYHMCNIQVSTWNGVNKTKIKMTFLIISVLAVCIAMAILIIAFMLNILYKCIKSFEGDRDLSQKCSSTDAEISIPNQSSEGESDVKTNRESSQTIEENMKPKKKFFDRCLFMRRSTSSKDITPKITNTTTDDAKCDCEEALKQEENPVEDQEFAVSDDAVNNRSNISHHSSGSKTMPGNEMKTSRHSSIKSNVSVKKSSSKASSKKSIHE